MTAEPTKPTVNRWRHLFAGDRKAMLKYRRVMQRVRRAGFTPMPRGPRPKRRPTDTQLLIHAMRTTHWSTRTK